MPIPAFRKSAALLAFAALTGSQAAQARQGTQLCITEPEVVGLMRFVLPNVIDATMKTCSTRLSTTGFVAVSGEAMRQKYLAGQDAAWPLARQGFIKFADGGEEVASLSDEALKPLLTDVLDQKLPDAIKPTDCAKIEHIMEIADRIAPEDFTALTGALLALAVGDKNKSMPICKNG